MNGLPERFALDSALFGVGFGCHLCICILWIVGNSTDLIGVVGCTDAVVWSFGTHLNVWFLVNGCGFGEGRECDLGIHLDIIFGRVLLIGVGK